MPVTDYSQYSDPYDPTVNTPKKPGTVFGTAAPAMNPKNPNNIVPPLPPAPTTPAPAPAQPISLQGGKVAYNPTTSPFGFDMTGPGYQQQMWDNNQNMWFESPSLDWVDQQLPQFQDPWAGEQDISQTLLKNPGTDYTQKHWEGVQGSMNQPTGAEQAISQGYQGPNNAQTAFDITRSRLPDSFQPQFDAYYDRMKQKVMSDVNSQAAARGVYGSNTALNGSVGAGLDIEAQRAKALTDFMFKDSENQRAWLDSLSGQGRSADISGLDAFGKNIEASRYGLDKTKTLGDLAFKADESELNRDKFELDTAETLDEMRNRRLEGGISTGLGSHHAHQGQLRDAFGAAGEADAERINRINTLYNQVTGFSTDTQNFVMENLNALLDFDQNVTTEEIQAMIAKAADERGWSQQQQERIMRDADAIVKWINGDKANQASKGTG